MDWMAFRENAKTSKTNADSPATGGLFTVFGATWLASPPSPVVAGLSFAALLSYADKSLDKFSARFEAKVEQDRPQFLFGPSADTARYGANAS